MKFLFIDTNIYLHFKDIEQIEWESILTNGDDFTIVVPPIVIREIDKQKDTGNGKVKSRARKISSKFGDIFLEGKTMKLVYSDCDDPSPDLFDGIKFNNLINDDWFILSAKNFQSTVDDTIIISA